MKTKLIQLTTDPNVGGGPRYIEGILKRLPQDEFEPYLVAPKGWLIDKIKSQKSNLKYKILNTENNTGEKVRQLRQLLIEIKQSGYPFAPMILHANSPQGVYLASQAIRGLGIYLVYTEHLWTLDYHLPSRIREWVQVAGLRSALKSASKVIVVSRAVNKFIIKHKITHKEKVEVIYPIVGEEGKVKVKKYSEKSNLPIAKDIYLGTIGGLNLVKGFHYLVEAVSMLKNDHPSIKLEIIGQGPEYENLKFQISKLKLTQNVKIITDAKSLNEYYDKWDIYLQPSLSETFGLSVYGAMRHGMAIIASRAGGLTELIEDRKSGLLISPASSESIKEAVLELLNNRSLMSKFGTGALKKSEEEDFQPERNFNKILAIYRELITNASAN